MAQDTKHNPTRRWKSHPWQARTAGFSRPPEKAHRQAEFSNAIQNERRRERRLAEDR